jgi:hypothetical protein
VEHCYTPVEKVCNGLGEEQCRTVYESSCTTRLVEKQKGMFVSDSTCEKLPMQICGAGCSYEKGVEACHDKVVSSVLSVPEEVCDLNPQKTCRFSTKLVPRLEPVNECTIVPKETCNLRFSNPSPGKKPFLTKWCLDESNPVSAIQPLENGLDEPEEESGTDSDSLAGALEEAGLDDYLPDISANDSKDTNDIFTTDSVPPVDAPQSFYVSDILADSKDEIVSYTAQPPTPSLPPSPSPPPYPSKSAISFYGSPTLPSYRRGERNSNRRPRNYWRLKNQQ